MVKSNFIITCLALIASAFSTYLVYFIFQTSVKINEKPNIIAYRYNDSGWNIENVGNGPAINIYIAAAKANQTVTDQLLISGLSKGKSICLPIDRKTYRIIVIYSDSSGNHYTNAHGENLNNRQEGIKKWFFENLIDLNNRKQWKFQWEWNKNDC